MDLIQGAVAYSFVVIGIVVSILLPLVKKALPKPEGERGEGPFRRFVKAAKPFLAVGLFSALTGILIVALLGDSLLDWRLALTAGYAWDSTIQKIGK